MFIAQLIRNPFRIRENRERCKSCGEICFKTSLNKDGWCNACLADLYWPGVQDYAERIRHEKL